MIVVMGLPLNVATSILGCIFSMLLSDFRAYLLPLSWRWQSFSMQIPKQTSIHCRCWGILSPHNGGICILVLILCLLWFAEAVSLCSWPILLKVLTLNVAICIELLHFSNFSFSLSSVADFLNTGPRALTSTGCTPLFTRTKSYVIWTCGLGMSHSNLSMTVFYSHLLKPLW